MPTPPTVRIFFSSPGDVKMERETARRIVERLQAEVGPRAALEPYFWEHEVLRATRDYQQNIPPLERFDVVVCILWSRLGSPLDPARHPRPEGGSFGSGTEYEFCMAMQAHRSRGAPDVLVFRNRTEPRRPSRPKEAREAVDREIDRLDQFFDTYFRTGEYYTAAVNSYRTLGEFEEKLTQGLHAFLEQHLPAPGPRARPVATYQGRPYLGLAAFDFADAPVFFGRTAQVGEVVEAFQTQELEARGSEDEGRRFVLVLGASGSGKSSLARAGVLPMLVQPGVIEGAQAWRRAIVKPGAAGGDPFLALAGALLAPEALPELGSDGTSAAALANLLRRQPGGAGLLVRQALSQAAVSARAAEELRLKDRLRQLEGDQREDDAAELRERLARLAPPAVRLALLADQLEELFTTAQTSEGSAAFVESLASIARSGRVFVLGTLRSDFYANCLAHPRLVELMKGSGTFALPAPGPADLGQMIRQPAAAAGLAFEEHPASGEKLDELLRDAALRDPAALPLLGYTLEQLYERRTSEGLLTLEAYRALGGLEGAIGRRAEEVFAALPGEAQAAFDSVWRQLVALGERGAAVRRRAELRALAASPGASALVEALVAARLLTADQAAGGERVVSIVHEALLRHWPRVVTWIEENRDFLRARARLATRLAEWSEQGRDEHYLIPPGPALGEAESVLARHAAALEPAEIEYVRLSTQHARSREEARQLRNRRITIGAVVLSVLALAGGVYAWHERGVANAERATALTQKTAAEKSEKEARASQTRAAYLLGIEMLENGKTREGLTNLAQTLTLDPAHVGARSRLYSYHLYGLPRAISVRSVSGSERTRQRISFGQANRVQRCAEFDARGAPQVFDLGSRKLVPGPWSAETGVVRASLNRTGTHLLCVHDDRRCRIWSVADGSASGWIALDSVEDELQLGDDGRVLVEGGSRVVEGRPRGHVSVWDVLTGELAREWTHAGSLASVQLDSARGRLATVGGDALCFDLARGVELWHLPVTDWAARSVRFAEIGDICVLVQEGGPAGGAQFVFVDARTGAPWPGARTLPAAFSILDYALNHDGSAVAVAYFADYTEILQREDSRGDRKFPDSTYPVLARFSPDDRLLLTASSDGTVRIWDAATAALGFEPIHHDERLADMVVSWDGRYLLSSTGRRTEVWDLAVGRALTMPLSQDGDPIAARFDSTNATLWTASSASGLQAWDARSLEAKGAPLLGGGGLVDVRIDERCARALAWLNDGSVVAVDLEKGRLASEPWRAPGMQHSPELSGDGTLAAVDAGGIVTFLDAASARPVGTPWTLPRPASEVVLGRAGRIAVALLTNPAGVLLHDRGTGQDSLLESPGITDAGLRISSDGRWLAAVCQRSVGFGVQLWDLQAGGKLSRTLPHDNPVTMLSFSPDSRWLATGTAGLVTQVWDVVSGQAASKPMRGKNVVRQLVFSPDSSLLAVHHGAGPLQLLDWREGCPVSEVLDVAEQFGQISFSPDGTRLVATRLARAEKRRCQASVWEIGPPEDAHLDLVALTEAATAMRVSTSGLPVACDPFEGWEQLRSTAPGLWFFQPPSRRAISPSLGASSLRWIMDPWIDENQIASSMPAVGMARAAISVFLQRKLIDQRQQLSKAPPEGSELEQALATLEAQQAGVDSLAESAARCAGDDATTCAWLSRQRYMAGDPSRARSYIESALRLAPDDLDVLRFAGDLYREANDCAAERAVLEHLRALEPGAVAHRVRLGLNRWRCGDRAAAQAELAPFADDPSIVGDDRAFVLTCLGRHKEALAVWAEAAGQQRASLGAYSSSALLTLAIAEQLAGDPEAAVAHYQELIAVEPGAADPASVAGTTPFPDLREAVQQVLEATLARHPELRPK